MKYQDSALLHDRESEQLRQQLKEATSELQAVQQEASEAQAAASERQKRFTMLNATFRRKEEALVDRAEQAEGALTQAMSDSAGAKHLAAQAKQVCPYFLHPCSGGKNCQGAA